MEFSELIPTLLFYLFSGVMLCSAVAVISARNPVHSVLFLILAFFNAAGLFVLLGAEYIAMTLVIVYVGAVAVLFLFVVMMLNVNFEAMRHGFLRYLPLGITVAAVILAQLVLAFRFSIHQTTYIIPSNQPIVSAEQLTNTEAIGALLYTYYIYPFQLAGLILLVAMIGAIVLTLREREGVKKQNITAQVMRPSKDCVTLVHVEPGQGAN